MEGGHPNSFTDGSDKNVIKCCGRIVDGGPFNVYISLPLRDPCVSSMFLAVLFLTYSLKPNVFWDWDNLLLY